MAKRKRAKTNGRLRVNRRTGKRYSVNMKRSRAAKLGARKRRGRKLKPGHKRKISLALKKVRRSGRTKYGRKSRYPRRRSGSRKRRA